MRHHPPVGEVKGKKEEVEEMFDAIAPRYDLLNRVLSAGIDKSWRKKAVNWLAAHEPKRILDVATGTADLAIESMRLQPEKVIGVDIADEMLKFGRIKIADQNLQEYITLQKGDAEKLPFSDSQFDAALVAFGVRNFENLARGLSNIFRVLKHDGTLVILEFSQPEHFPVKQLYNFYSITLLPLIGRMLSKDNGAYSYLPESISSFPHGEEFLGILKEAGYEDVQQRKLTFGIASLYKGRVVKKK